MYPSKTPFNDLKLADIASLIENGIPESRTLDYKRDLYGTDDDEKTKFLCDVTAFANTAGGYLVIGMHEEDKIAKEITPVTIENLDTLESRFQNWLSTSVDPPLRGVEFQPVDAGDGKTVLVIKIPRSISRPHAVRRKKNYWQFHGRHSTGNHPYEMDELRRAILQSETLAVRIRNFRNDRLAQISVGETPLPLFGGAKIVLHVIPVSAFELGQRYDVSRLSNVDLPPLYASGWSRRLNFDGSVTYRDDSDTGLSFNYTQISHSGVVEAVDTLLLQKRTEKKIIPSIAYEQTLIEALNTYLDVLGRLDVPFPLWIGLSLLGVKDYFMWADEHMWLRQVHPIDREELILPEIPVDDASIPAERILKPAFDSIWNACGYERSMNYDKDGNWIVKGR